MFVAYDLKGLQAQIFAVPKLKAICGTSSLLAEFDANADKRPGERIFAGGGRGVYWCPDQQQRFKLIDRLIADAHHDGFDLRIGIDHSLANACHHADELYPFVPAPLTGDNEPCRLSGLWPAAPKRPNQRDGVHPVIARRLQAGYQDFLGASLLPQLRSHPDFPAELTDYEIRFIRNIDSPSSQGEPLEDDQAMREWEQSDAQAAAHAIGRRSRWAVICLDGNDIGKQFLAYEEFQRTKRLTDDHQREWVRAMSRALAEATRHAFLEALIAVLKSWLADHQGVPKQCSYIDRIAKHEHPTLVLPLRPLILGGDDITLLIHPAYAMTFVRAMTQHFAQQSVAAELEYWRKTNSHLWPATAGRLTMSAGVLYCKTTFPLHMGIDVAEGLLKGAKTKFRHARPDEPEPTPAAVDWESITETLVESTRDRRRRELEFIDPELDGHKVVLYQRPYLIEPHPELPHLAQVNQLADQLASIPTSVRAQILPRLKGAWSERVAFFASVAKRHPLLKQLLWEGTKPIGSSWQVTEPQPPHHAPDQFSLITGVPDALLLLEEERRLAQHASIT